MSDQDDTLRAGPADLVAAWLDDLGEYPDVRAVTNEQLAVTLLHLLADNGMRIVEEGEACGRIEPVLARYGIPMSGLPLTRAAAQRPLSVDAAGTYRALGQGDRGDLTSDIARAILQP